MIGFMLSFWVRNELNLRRSYPPKFPNERIGDDLRTIIKSLQVAKYLAKYGQVLVTNYREFASVVQGDNGQAVVLETYSLGESEDAFWQACIHARKTTESQGPRLEEFIKRSMLRAAVLSDPEELVWFLAS